MMRASTVPSLNVNISMDVPSGIFPNGSVFTVVLPAVIVVHNAKHNKLNTIVLNIFMDLGDPANPSNPASNRLPRGTVSHSPAPVNLHDSSEFLTEGGNENGVQQ